MRTHGNICWDYCTLPSDDDSVRALGLPDGCLSGVPALLLLRGGNAGDNSFGAAVAAGGLLDDALQDLLPLVEVFLTCKAFTTCSGDLVLEIWSDVSSEPLPDSSMIA